MSAAWVHLATTLCLLTGLRAAENSEVVWKDPGKSTTIKCSSPSKEHNILDLRKGLKKDVFVMLKSNNQTEFGSEFEGRIQEHGEFPKVDILIKNLSSEDTGLYWCLFRTAHGPTLENGTGSVLLVVRGEMSSGSCGLSHEDVILVSVVISTGAFLAVIMCILMWLMKTRTSYSALKPRPDPLNCVYEDMSATLRRPTAQLPASQPRTRSCTDSE